MKFPDHFKRQRPATVDHLSDATSRADEGLKIFARQVHLFHAEFDRLNRIRRVDRMVLSLVILSENQEHIQDIPVRGPGLCTPKTLDIGKSLVVVSFGLNGMDVHAAPFGR